MPWGLDQARELYNIAYWGGGYFGINGDGHLVAHPQLEAGAGIDLYRLSDEIKATDDAIRDDVEL